MKAFGINQYGASNVLEAFDIAIPKIGPNEILVKTRVFAINPFDVAIRNGDFKNYLTLFFPTILGTDGVGEVVKAGKNVKYFNVGDLVIAHAGTGTYAEYFKVNQNNAGLFPPALDIKQAAALPLAGITAYNTLVHASHIKMGQVLVVLGAAGGVGSMITQVAKALGAYVIGVDLAKANDTVRALGADEFIAYDQEQSPLLENIADVVIDATNESQTAINTAIALAKQNSMILSLNPQSVAVENNKNLEFLPVKPNYRHPDTYAFAALFLMIRNQQIKIKVNKVEPFTLKGIREGQDLVSQGDLDGKIIVSI